MLKRPTIKVLFAVSLSLLTLTAAAVPARASMAVPGDPLATACSSLVDFLVSLWLGDRIPPSRPVGKTTTSGALPPPSCVAGTPGCPANTQADSSAGADPFGKP